MDYLLNLAVLIFLALPIWLFLKLFKTPGNLPPGPLSLPIIGNLHNLSKNPHRSLAELAKVHGPLMSLRLGSLTTIVVSSPYVAQQVLQKHDLLFSNRWVPDAFRGNGHDEFSVALIPTNLIWRNIRKICNSQLLSNKCLDASKDVREKKVKELISYIDGFCRDGAAVNISQAVFSSNLSLLSTTFFSLDIEDPDSTFCRNFKQTISYIASTSGDPNIGDFFPVLKGLDLQRIRRRMGEHFGKIIEYFQQLIDERLAKEIDSTIKISDVLDSFLKVNQEKKELEMPYILHSLLSLFAGGTETTSSTIEWAMAELLRERNKLKKARAELDMTIGKGNLVKEADITRLPYLQAVIKETLRLHPPVPFLLPRLHVMSRFVGFVCRKTLKC